MSNAAHFSSEDIRAHLEDDYRHRIELEERQIGELELDRDEIATQEAQWASRHLLLTEKNHVISSFQQGILDQDVYDKLLADIDTRLLRLESGGSATNDKDRDTA